ncbi:DUF481 domain-containing protein [Sulfurimonas sp. SAG-AH-194-I05]|nr:DUF481 domain-containing protein [Sulfurimonas sp. SAG-AH-194-I05]MDF1875258.1 DUF481 domain-containing protein [Sulfurimonas sp. SAG-AH-194-I05]
MKKTLMLSLVCISLLGAEQTLEEKKQEITAAKKQIQRLQAKLKTLEASLLSPKEQLTKKNLQHNALKTHAEVGFTSTSGNTDIKSYKLDIELKKNWDKHHYTFAFDTQYTDDKGIPATNKFLGVLTYNYQLSSRLALDYLLGYKEDRFSGFNYQAYTGPGLKYLALKQKKHTLSIQGNILSSQDKITTTSLKQNYSSLRAKGVYEWKIFDNLKFQQDLSYRVDIENTTNYFIYAKSAFISKISDIFSFGISYKYDYVNKPPSAIKNADKTLSANIIMDY